MGKLENLFSLLEKKKVVIKAKEDGSTNALGAVPNGRLVNRKSKHKSTKELIQPVVEGNPAIQDLIRALAQAVGNKVYLRDLEVLLNKIEMDRREQETVYHLVRDLKGLK